MKKIIEIPEGYKVRIEGNKVILEPEESEDERIRKKVIEVLKLNIRGAESQMQASRGVDRTFEVYACNKAISWLEKQGSQNLANSAKTCKDEQKPAWSEDDETGWTNTMIMIKECAAHHYTKDSIKLVVDWLKSLKERYTWKPSDEQMSILFKYAEQNNADGSELTSLYNDLKKLKG